MPILYFITSLALKQHARFMVLSHTLYIYIYIVETQICKVVLEQADVICMPTTIQVVPRFSPWGPGVYSVCGNVLLAATELTPSLPSLHSHTHTI